MLAGVVLLGALALTVTAQECQCTPENQHVKYIVVEMPLPPSSAPVPAPLAAAEAPAPSPIPDHVTAPPAGSNTTSTFGPVVPPEIDCSDPINLMPASNVSLYYGSTVEGEPGSIHMSLAMDTPAVVLEHVAAITKVECGDDSLTVSFNDTNAFATALEDWQGDEAFVLITNHLGNCDAEFERGFFIATNVTSDPETLSISVLSVREDIAHVAGDCEMTFTSLPAATLTKRITWNPKTQLKFEEALPENTVLFNDGRFVNIVADEAYFTSTITFSGYLNYNFWGFSLKALEFDIDTQFEAEVGLSADFLAAFKETLSYEPDELSYSLISVPGLVSLGPGIAFGIGLDFSATAAVGIEAGLGVKLANGNVHVDFLDQKKTKTSGWEPQYTTYANITEMAEVRADVSADVTVELAVELLGGLIDLSSGLTASPGFSNVFRLNGKQGAAASGSPSNHTAGVSVPKDPSGKCGGVNSVEFQSDFFFNLTAFATKWWKQRLYTTQLPIWDACYTFT